MKFRIHSGKYNKHVVCPLLFITEVQVLFLYEHRMAKKNSEKNVWYYKTFTINSSTKHNILLVIANYF